jgi:hypothetical protein
VHECCTFRFSDPVVIVCSGEDPVTAAIESVKIAEELDVTKLPEINGPSKPSAPKEVAPPEEPKAIEKPRVAETSGTSEVQTAGGDLLERLKKGADAGRSGIGGSIAESKRLVEASGSKVGEFFGQLKSGVAEKIGGGKGAPEIAQQVVESKADAPGTGGLKVGDLFGQLKSGVVEKIGGGKAVPEVSQQAVESKADAPVTGGAGSWFSEWTSKPKAPVTKTTEGKTGESKTGQGFGAFFSGGSQAEQPPAKQGLFQPTPPAKEETGLAAAWRSFTSLDFLPDNVKSGALTVKKVLSTILTVLALVLTVFSKATGLAADLLNIIARGL